MSKIPVTVITGFLGAGKTTLIRHLLGHAKGKRIALVINEFGDLGVDKEVLAACGEETCREEDMIELSNGCICCSTNNDLVDSIVRVLGRSQPVDHILVETTGVADPLPVAQTVQRPEFRDALRLDAIVAVADAEQFSLDLFDGHAVRSQLRHADAILVNKCDRVGEERLGSVEEKIRAVNAEARLLRTTRSAAPLPLILDVDLHRPASHGHGHHHAHLDEDGFVSLSFESDRPFSVARFQEFLDNRPPGLFRGKGFLRLAETGKRYVFHLVGSRFTLDQDRSATGANRLVLIGRQLDTEDLRVRLAHCLVD
jgi:G3E family GTPase